jgi:hypothetical protein
LNIETKSYTFYALGVFAIAHQHRPYFSASEWRRQASVLYQQTLAGLTITSSG